MNQNNICIFWTLKVCIWGWFILAKMLLCVFWTDRWFKASQRTELTEQLLFFLNGQKDPPGFLPHRMCPFSRGCSQQFGRVLYYHPSHSKALYGYCHGDNRAWGGFTQCSTWSFIGLQPHQFTSFKYVIYFSELWAWSSFHYVLGLSFPDFKK